MSKKSRWAVWTNRTLWGLGIALDLDHGVTLVIVFGPWGLAVGPEAGAYEP